MKIDKHSDERERELLSEQAHLKAVKQDGLVP